MKLPAYNENLPYGGQEPIQEIHNYTNQILVPLAIMCGVSILYGIGGMIDRFRNLQFMDASLGFIANQFKFAFLFGFAFFCVLLISNKVARIKTRK